MPSSTYSIVNPMIYPAGAGVEHLEYYSFPTFGYDHYEPYHYYHPELPNLQQRIEYMPYGISPDYHWAMNYNHIPLPYSDWSDVGLTGLPRTSDDYSIAFEYHDCDFGIDANQHRHQYPHEFPRSPFLCGQQPNEDETVVTSIELPPIQSLVDFPWTPVGVELPPLRGLWREVKEEGSE